MTETKIQKILSAIKQINKKTLAMYYSTGLGADNDGASVGSISDGYTSGIKELIGSINKVKSERILKALGFEKVSVNTYIIPANALYLIEPGTELESTTGEKVLIDDIDLDTRNGMLGYHIILKGVKK